MKKNVLGVIAALTLFASPIFATGVRDYWNAPGRPANWYSDQDWMGKLRNNTRLSQLSIPGTHDSAARGGGILAQTQGMGLLDQLVAGIRMWDIRLAGPSGFGNCAKQPTLYTYHGSTCQEATVEDVFTAAIVFLHNHPTETVLIRIKREDISPAYDLFTSDGFVSRLKTVLGGTVNVNGSPVRIADYLYKGGETNPRLVDLRRKIFIFKDFAGDLDRSMVTTRNWCTTLTPNDPNDCPDPLNIQDEYKMRTNEDLARKWAFVRNQLVVANASYTNFPNTLFVNFASTNALAGTALTGGYPFFFASGQLTPENFAAQWWTGYFAGGCPPGVCLPEFPVIGGRVYYEGINILLANEIRKPENRFRNGIILMDFPGGGLIGDIITANDRLRATGAPVATPNPPNDASRWYNNPVTLNWNWQGSTSLLQCPVSVRVELEGKNRLSSTCTDVAGNQSFADVFINIDYTRPRGKIQLSRPVMAPTTTSRLVVQAVAGSFEDVLSGVNPSSVRYRIYDSYGTRTREGPVTVSMHGAPAQNATFFFQVSLDTAIRPGEPRTYRIAVLATDLAGNLTEVVADAVVR